MVMQQRHHCHREAALEMREALNFTGFNGEDPKGDWTIMIVSNGAVTTVTATLKVNYNYSY